METTGETSITVSFVVPATSNNNNKTSLRSEVGSSALSSAETTGINHYRETEATSDIAEAPIGGNNTMFNGYNPTSIAGAQHPTTTIEATTTRNIDNDSSDEQPASSRSSRDLQRHYSSRHNLISSIPTLDYDSMTEVVIDDLIEYEPTSAILEFCKKRFLVPYEYILGIVGLYPMCDFSTCFHAAVSHIVTSLILILLCFGYFLQYLAAFRRDRGLYANSSDIYTLIYEQPYHRDAHDLGEIIFVYLIPSCLHLIGFLYSIYVIRIADNEQLQNLIERVYLLTGNPRKLCITLWVYIISCFIWLGLLTTYVLISILPKNDIFQNVHIIQMSSNTQYYAKGFLVVTVLVHDSVQIIVLMSYCIQCYLLRLYLEKLHEKIIHHTIKLEDWMTEILEFRKLLNHLNSHIAIPICFFTVLNLCYGFSCLIYLFEEYEWNYVIQMLSLNIMNFSVWLLIGMMPFFHAASVTRACKSIQESGHQIRVRPFVYRDTPVQDLDSTMLFSSSLNMAAKLYCMPVQGNYLCCSILAVSITIITLGMCLNISFGNI